MKGMDVFCGFPASTAICSSMESRSMVRRGHRPIERCHNPKPYVRCSSQLMPIIPKSASNYHEKSRKSSSSSFKESDLGRKSCADISSPHGNSSRYLLSDGPFIANNWLSDQSDRHASQLVPSQTSKPNHVRSTDLSLAFKSSSSSPRSRNNQVVVLRVSIHCKGCEGKVRKHISKMEGVRLFTIDLEAKKVTVIGDVTPLGVLAFVSRVKNAQPSSSPPNSSPSPSQCSTI